MSLTGSAVQREIVDAECRSAREESARLRRELQEELAAIKARDGHFLVLQAGKDLELKIAFLEADILAALNRIAPE